MRFFGSRITRTRWRRPSSPAATLASSINNSTRAIGCARTSPPIRDRHAAEVDLIIESADRLTLVEAKAAQTASPSLFDGARRVKERISEPSRPCDIVLAYGGHEAQHRSDSRLVPWTRLHEEAWAENH